MLAMCYSIPSSNSYNGLKHVSWLMFIKNVMVVWHLPEFLIEYNTFLKCCPFLKFPFKLYVIHKLLGKKLILLVRIIRRSQRNIKHILTQKWHSKDKSFKVIQCQISKLRYVELQRKIAGRACQLLMGHGAFESMNL